MGLWRPDGRVAVVGGAHLVLGQPSLRAQWRDLFPGPHTASSCGRGCGLLRGALDGACCSMLQAFLIEAFLRSLLALGVGDARPLVVCSASIQHRGSLLARINA